MKTILNKRLLAWLLALVMLLGTVGMVACADDTTDDPEDPATEDDGTTPDEDPEEDEEPRLPLNLPTATYGGDEIHFLEWSCGGQETAGESWIPWEEVAVDDYDGDLLNSAIYDRNSHVEETYDVKITKEYVSIDKGYIETVRNNNTTGDNAFQVITLRTTNIATLVFENVMANMFEMENLHTDMPWWNQDSVRSYTLGTNLFFAAPEMLLRDKGATACMFFNNKVATDHEINNLYELASEGEWTQEELISMSEDVAADLDGSDAMDSMLDMWGVAGGQRDIPYYLFTGSGLKFAHINDEGYIEYDFGDEESIVILKDIFDYIMYSDFYTSGHEFEVNNVIDVFTGDRSLFYFGMVKHVMQLRNMESIYGVLPIPKASEDQESYSSLVWMHHDSVLGIPAAVPEGDLGMVSTVLEHMSYISYYDVYPSFYDTVILTKSTHDEESKRMLQIVFETRSFDPGQYWDNGSGLHGSNGYLTFHEKGVSDVASTWASFEEAVYEKFDELNEKIDGLE